MLTDRATQIVKKKSITLFTIVLCIRPTVRYFIINKINYRYDIDFDYSAFKREKTSTLQFFCFKTY